MNNFIIVSKILAYLYLRMVKSGFSQSVTDYVFVEEFSYIGRDDVAF